MTTVATRNLAKLIAVTALACSLGAARTPAQFGAKGGSKDPAKWASLPDDSAAFDRLSAALKPGDSVTFAGTKAYRQTRPLIVTCPNVSIDFAGALLVSDTSAYPFNHHLIVTSDGELAKPHRDPGYVAVPLLTFEADIAEGWFLLPGGIRKTAAWFMFGTDPLDDHEEHYGVLVQPEEYRVWIPWAISGRAHKAFRVDRICEGVTIRNLRVASMPGRITNVNVWFDRVRDSQLSGLSGDVTVAVLASDSDGVTVRNLDVRLTYPPGHTASGRFFSAWQTRNFLVDGARVRIPADVPAGKSRGVFLESNCRRGVIDNVDVVSAAPAFTGFPVFFITGGCRDLIIPYVRITQPATETVYLYDVGGAANQQQPRFDIVEIVSGHMGAYDDWISRGWMKVGRTIRPAVTP